MGKFEGKSIYFVSDSNMANPYFLEYLRADCARTGRKTYFRNKGIAGARMDMVKNCIEEELAVESPDYVALCFGGNDLGIWLYDQGACLGVLQAKEREERIKNYVCGLEENILYLRQRGIEPILLTPLCYDENIQEQENVKTDKDSKEKAVIQDTLFTKESFKNINRGLGILSEKGKEIADKLAVEVWDLYEITKRDTDNSCFYQDGVHYNEKGHKIVAQAIYRCLFGVALSECSIMESIKELSKMEADERAYFFVKYNAIFLTYGKKEGKELLDAVDTFIREKGYVDGLTRARADGFFRFAVNPNAKQKEIVRKIKELY